MGVPLAERVAQREDPLLGAGAFLVAATAAEHRVEAVLADGVEQRNGLERVADAVGTFGEATVGEVVLDLRDMQAQTVFLDDMVAERQNLGQIVPGVDVQQRERQRRGPEGLECQVEQNRGVLAAREQDHRTFEFAGDLAEDVDRLRLERVESVELVAVQPDSGFRKVRIGECHEECNPHSVLARPAHRPLRGSAPGSGLTVQGAHPMDG